jgi:cephalosporin hydroxylase
VSEGDTVLVTLDSNHTKDHVLAELRAYGELVTSGSYIVAMDGIMGDLVGAPRAGADWGWNNPREAAREFAQESGDFVLEEPPRLFNEGVVEERVTYWPDAFLRRR